MFAWNPARTSCVIPGALAAVSLACAAPAAEHQAVATADGAGAEERAAADLLGGWLDAPESTPLHQYALPRLDERDATLEFGIEPLIRERRGDPAHSFGQAPPTVALGGDGRIFVYDADNYRVAVFNPDGEFLYQFGSRGQGPGEFNNDARGAIGYLGDRLLIFYAYNRVGLWTLTGEFIEAPELRVRDPRLVALDDGGVFSSGVAREISVRQSTYSMGRYAFVPGALDETLRYASIPVGLRPSSAARRDGRAYVTSINAGITQVVAFDPDASVRWVTQLRPPERPVMPSDLLLDGRGQVYVLPRINRPDATATPVARAIDVLSPDGELLASATMPDLQINVLWQQARGDFVYGVRADPDTFEWQVVRFRLALVAR